MLALSCVSMLAVFADDSQPAGTADKPQTTKGTGKRPPDSPGWIIIEEEFWTPLRFSPLEALDSIRYHYRRNEEALAANEIDKAVSWLKLAAGHAMPTTKDSFKKAITDLELVASDLRNGRVADAAKVDAALAKAAHALGEWRFFKAKQFWGKTQADLAGRDLELAAAYLAHAAESAKYQFGSGSQTIITKLYENGKEKSESTVYKHNDLESHLKEVSNALKELSIELKK